MKSILAVESEKVSGKKPTLHIDYRKLLDDKSIDAVALATPNHWHALQTIWACQAGKDVYVEKPASHNIFEGRKMVEAARKYGRIVQTGTQCRSSPNIREGIQKLKEGVIGRVYMARGVALVYAPVAAITSTKCHQECTGICGSVRPRNLPTIG